MKANEVRSLIANGNYKQALLGASNFHLGINKEQRSVMRRAYECYIRPEFYKSIGKNIDDCIKAGIAVLQEVM